MRVTDVNQTGIGEGGWGGGRIRRNLKSNLSSRMASQAHSKSTNIHF